MGPSRDSSRGHILGLFLISLKLVKERDKEERKKVKFKPTTHTRTSWNDTIKSRTMETYRRSKCVMITRKEIAKTFIRRSL